MTYIIKPVNLCGGSGTRLWPLSRESFPKQFVPLINGKSLLYLTVTRVKDLGSPICVSNEEHRLENPGITDLEMIEVQSGSYMGEVLLDLKIPMVVVE